MRLIFFTLLPVVICGCHDLGLTRKCVADKSDCFVEDLLLLIGALRKAIAQVQLQRTVQRNVRFRRVSSLDEQSFCQTTAYTFEPEDLSVSYVLP